MAAPTLAMAVIIEGSTPVKLPSKEGGFVAHIRPVSIEACLQALGYIPDAFGATVAAKDDQVRAALSKRFVEEHPEWSQKLTALLLSESVVAMTAGGITEPCRWVEKRQIECMPGELSILDAVSEEWALAVMNAALTLNGLTEGAAESARPFLGKRKSFVRIGSLWQTLRARPGDAAPGPTH